MNYKPWTNNHPTDAIEKHRQQAIEELIHATRKLTDSLYEKRHRCSDLCPSVLLGTLTRELHELKLFDPSPKRPLLGLDYATNAIAVRNIRFPGWAEPETYIRSETHKCGYQAEVNTMRGGLGGLMKGLDLKSFL